MKDEFILKFHFKDMKGPVYMFVQKLMHLDGLTSEVDSPKARLAIQESSLISQAKALEESSGMQLEVILKTKGSEDESTPYSSFTLEDAN